MAPIAGRPYGSADASRYTKPPKVDMLSEVRKGILKPLASDHAPNTGLKQKDEKEKPKKKKVKRKKGEEVLMK